MVNTSEEYMLLVNSAIISVSNNHQLYLALKMRLAPNKYTCEYGRSCGECMMGSANYGPTSVGYEGWQDLIHQNGRKDGDPKSVSKKLNND